MSDNGFLSKKVVATVCPLHYDTKSEQSDCNKSSDVNKDITPKAKARPRTQTSRPRPQLPRPRTPPSRPKSRT